MKLLRAAIPALAILLAAATAQAETFTLACKTTPTFLTTIKRTLEGLIQEEIDQAQFSDSRATVQLKLISLQTSTESVNSDDLLSGITIHDSGDPDGLAFAVDGDIDFGTAGNCLYTYRVTVLTRGRDNLSGERMSTRTESIITMTTPPFGSLRRN